MTKPYHDSDTLEADIQELGTHIPVKDFDNPTDAHYLENLMTLCRSCHRAVEQLPEEEQREII